MLAGIHKSLLLFTLIIFLSGCEGTVIHLPTPTDSRPGFPAQPSTNLTPEPALLEKRLVILEWPLKIRERDSALILLTISMDEQGNLTATAQSSSGSIEPVPFDIPNIYDTHNIVALARLDLAGLEAYREAIREPLRPGREVTFRWSIRANESGIYRGVVWLHLELVSKKDGTTEQQLVMARTIEVEAVTVLGMPGWLARSLGALGLVASTVFGYPLVQRQIEGWLKNKKNNSPPSLETANKLRSVEEEEPEIKP